MPINPEYRNLLKYLLASALFFFLGTIQGVVQLLPPIRAWLDSVGSPVTGPGHMIDPLAHAHINLVGGVVILGMATTYYLLQQISGKPLWSKRLVGYSFWFTALGVSMFYSTLLIFGIIEGRLLLSDPDAVPAVHDYYAPVVSTVASVMGAGVWIFFANVFLTARSIFAGDDR